MLELKKFNQVEKFSQVNNSFSQCSELRYNLYIVINFLMIKREYCQTKAVINSHEMHVKLKNEHKHCTPV
jgi:hypothetical protein